MQAIVFKAQRKCWASLNSKKALPGILAAKLKQDSLWGWKHELLNLLTVVIVPYINSANIKLKLGQEFELLVQFSLMLITHHHSKQHVQKCDKDGASFCYCTYVLFISGYSDFLRNLPTNNIFAWFTTMWKKQTLARAIRIQKENWG